MRELRIRNGAVTLAASYAPAGNTALVALHGAPARERGPAAWIEEMDFDPHPIFAQVRVPTLLFYGEDDAWTPVSPSIEAWRHARGDDVEIVVVPGASHELILPGGTLAPEYEHTLVEWLATR